MLFLFTQLALLWPGLSMFIICPKDLLRPCDNPSTFCCAQSACAPCNCDNSNNTCSDINLRLCPRDMQGWYGCCINGGLELTVLYECNLDPPQAKCAVWQQEAKSIACYLLLHLAAIDIIFVCSMLMKLLFSIRCMVNLSTDDMKKEYWNFRECIEIHIMRFKYVL